MTPMGIVIIGRNEGLRLDRCLRSVSAHRGRIIYVDSGSIDNSVEIARSYRAEVVQLDTSVPFSAARARNEGFARLLAIAPDSQVVQFVDGDCEIAAGWLERGAAELCSRPELAAVCGELREQALDASIYNRLCDLEWNRAIGEIESCGGVAMYRAEFFQALGGFDASVVAGEEPELCSRLRDRGYVIVRLRDRMAMHDSAMHRFGQWWKRQVRGGYGALDVASRFERFRGGGPFTRQVDSARMWAVGVPLMILFGALCGFATRGAFGALFIASVLASALPLQMARLSIRTFRAGVSAKVAVANGVLTVVSKFAHVVGHIRYRHDQRMGRAPRLIEHKSSLPKITNVPTHVLTLTNRP